MFNIFLGLGFMLFAVISYMTAIKNVDEEWSEPLAVLSGVLIFLGVAFLCL